VDVWSFIKSPYGLMIGFMVFGIFVFPMLKVNDIAAGREDVGQKSSNNLVHVCILAKMFQPRISPPATSLPTH